MAIQCRNTRQIFTIPDPKQEEYKKRINVSFFSLSFLFLLRFFGCYEQGFEFHSRLVIRTEYFGTKVYR